MKRSFILAVLLTVIVGSAAQAAVVRVPEDQPTIQAGIAAAVDGDTVLVADGTYRGDGNRDISFQGKGITVRSSNGADACIIDCESLGRAFLFTAGETAAAVLAGFTIAHGASPSEQQGNMEYSAGGAVLIEGSCPVISGCRFVECQANVDADAHVTLSAGGAVYLRSADVRIRNCQFSGCLANVLSGAQYSGVARSCGDSDWHLSRITISYH